MATFLILFHKKKKRKNSHAQTNFNTLMKEIIKWKKSLGIIQIRNLRINRIKEEKSLQY